MWPDSSETQELLQRAGDGEPEAMNRLLERHRLALRQMIDLRLDRALSRRVDASDVVQDVLLKASRRLPEYLRNPSVPFPVWLRGLARDHLIDEHRRHRASARRSVDREQPLMAASFMDRSSFELAAAIRDHELTPAAAALRGELERRFQTVLAALDEADREILLMRHFEQLSNSDVARILGLSEPAAGMRHLRALRKLRVALGESPSKAGWT
jgi:RNA polymerase sigma-70 factor (ECF subfamily)